MNTSNVTEYKRIPHAAHYGSGLGHDVEQWIVRAPTFAAALSEAHAAVPKDASYHSGYRTVEGVQYWIFSRTATLSPGRCEHCR